MSKRGRLTDSPANISDYVSDRIIASVTENLKKKILSDVLHKIADQTGKQYCPCQKCGQLIDLLYDEDRMECGDCGEILCKDCEHEHEKNHPNELCASIDYEHQTIDDSLARKKIYKRDFMRLFDRDDMAMTLHPYCAIIDHQNKKFLLLNRHYKPLGIGERALVKYGIEKEDEKFFFYESYECPWDSFNNYRKFESNWYEFMKNKVYGYEKLYR